MKHNGKALRILGLYSKLEHRAIINKSEEANFFGVNEKTIQRDIDEIRDFIELSNSSRGITNTIVYDRKEKGYKLESNYNLQLSQSEILAMCKILMDSRAFTKMEMKSMIERLIDCCVPEKNQKIINDLIINEMFHYIEPRHQSVFIDEMWKIGKAIQQHSYIEIQYKGIQGTTVKTRKLKPLAIMFSEYYFYLVAFIDDKTVQENFNVLDDLFPTIYRIDRIQGLKNLEEKFKIPYSSRFEEGEFKKRIQFMYGGKLRKIRFKYVGYSVEAILDKLPTAKIEKEEKSEDGKKTIYTISAEVFGDGIDMWIRSQGDNILGLEVK